MLVNAKQILETAKCGGYALPAPDYIDLDSARTFVRVAEELGQPLILSYPQVLDKMLPLKEAAAVGRVLGECAAVPVALHLDHGTDRAFIEQAIDLGFTSVMIDASGDSFEENVRKTREIVALAHAKDVTVEAEIGHVGQGDNFAGFEETDTVYTTVAEAKAFAEQTGVDMLAVSIGTVHGIYKNLEKPSLHFERLHELADAVPIPLVLHGGSGTGDESLRRCALEGITKINIFTDLLTGAMDRICADRPENYLAIKQSADRGMADALRHYYRVFSKMGDRNEQEGD